MHPWQALASSRLGGHIASVPVLTAWCRAPLRSTNTGCAGGPAGSTRPVPTQMVSDHRSRKFPALIPLGSPGLHLLLCSLMQATLEPRCLGEVPWGPLSEAPASFPTEHHPTPTSARSSTPQPSSRAMDLAAGFLHGSPDSTGPQA